MLLQHGINRHKNHPCILSCFSSSIFSFLHRTLLVAVLWTFPYNHFLNFPFIYQHNETITNTGVIKDLSLSFPLTETDRSPHRVWALINIVCCCQKWRVKAARCTSSLLGAIVKTTQLLPHVLTYRPYGGKQSRVHFITMPSLAVGVLILSNKALHFDNDRSPVFSVNASLCKLRSSVWRLPTRNSSFLEEAYSPLVHQWTLTYCCWW